MEINSWSVIYFNRYAKGLQSCDILQFNNNILFISNYSPRLKCVELSKYVFSKENNIEIRCGLL